MPQQVAPLMTMLRRPSAWLPLALSFVALAFVAGFAITVGIAGDQSHDEGVAARTFQLTMLGVVAAIVFFAIRWLPVAPKAAIRVLALQVAVAALPVITILLLER